MKQNWIDLCDDEDEYDQSGQEQNDKIDDSQHPIINLPSKETKEQNLSLDNLSPQGIEDNNKSDQVKKKFLYQSQPANEMLEQLEELPDGNEYFINLFNVDSKATVDIIKQYFCDIKILNVFANPNKIGNYDLIIENKEEVRKFIEKGAGKINKRQFFMRISYRNFKIQQNISKKSPNPQKKSPTSQKKIEFKRNQDYNQQLSPIYLKKTQSEFNQFENKKLQESLTPQDQIKSNELKFGMNSQRQYQKQYEELKELPVLKPKMYSERKPKVRKDKGRKIVYQYKKEAEFDEMLKTNSNLMEEENNNMKKQTHYKSLNDFSSNTEHKYYQKRKDGMKKHMEVEYVPKQSLEETKEIQMKSLQNQDIIKIEVDEQKCFSQELEKPEEYQQQQQEEEIEEEEFVQKVNEEKQLQCQQEQVESLNKSLNTKEKSKEQIMQDKLEKKKQKNKMKTKNKRKKQKELKEQQLQKEEAILKEKKEKEEKIKEEEEKASQKVSLNQNLKTEERSYFSFFRCYI